ncbi:MAG: hypothetical protein DRZ90_05415 [Spirochaetes bacterium]|nr:MAG: hypothetical protein DRZ90_05415 [Spirochaetota bacterium]
MKQAGFQARILLTYSLFVTVLIVSFSLVYFISKVSKTDKAVYQDLVNRADRMSDQLDTVISTMDFASTDILSLSEFIPSLVTLAHFERDDGRYQKDIVEALKYIEKSIYRYSLMRDFYRVSVYTPSLDYYSNNFDSYPEKATIRRWLDNNIYLERSANLSGRIMVMPMYLDPWDVEGQVPVMGIIRAVDDFQEGNITGYIEVQNPYSIVEKIFNTPDEMNIGVTTRTREGEILYQSLNSPTSRRRVFFREPYTYQTISEYSHISIEISRDRWAGISATVKTIWIFFMITMAVLFISLYGIRYFTIQLTRPLRELRKHIDTIELGSLPTSANLNYANNEIEALDFALTHFHNRLNEALKREIVSQSLQLQANFDSLQAQVNPHFLYNLLNVISSMGLESGNEEICDVCDRTAALLRYSTSTGERDTTIKFEIDHVMNYLSLLKNRYEHKLTYSCFLDEKILNVKIPKMILQPIIENSINHNFQKGRTKVHIKIKGFHNEVDGWLLCISDDGSGISENKLKQIRTRFSEIREVLNSPSSNVELNLGGLGLANTYARLFLYYQDQFRFKIDNLPKGGVEIQISGEMNKGPGGK